MIGLTFKADFRSVTRGLNALQRKQIPFACSLALNELALGVAKVEHELLDDTFETPTPFTENAYRIVRATKTKPIAIVAAKDIQAQYLKPYVMGGDRFLGEKRGMLAPRAVNANRYGNLTKGKLASLKTKPNVFIGPMKTKSGRIINGVWQGPAALKANKRKSGGVSTTHGGVKLLIQFEDTTPVRKRLAFFEKAESYIDAHAANAFNAALTRALASARR